MVVHYQTPYIDSNPSKTIVSGTIQFGNNKNLDGLRQFGNNKKDLNVLQQSGEGNQILDDTWYLNFQIIKQLNIITWELNFNITIVDKAKCDEYKSIFDPMRELSFNITLVDKAKRDEYKSIFDPTR